MQGSLDWEWEWDALCGWGWGVLLRILAASVRL
jgi:hypothetical protein